MLLLVTAARDRIPETGYERWELLLLVTAARDGMTNKLDTERLFFSVKIFRRRGYENWI